MDCVTRSLTRCAGPAVCSAVGRRLRFVSNHQGFFALGWHGAGELLGETELKSRAAATIDSIIEHQSPDGWYAEYGGPDPGYESLGISYLATYLAETGGGHRRLTESLTRSVEFFSNCVIQMASWGVATAHD